MMSLFSNRKKSRLLKQLEHSEAKDRYQAVMDLGLMGDTELIDELDKVANLDDHPRVRTLAAKAVRTLEILRQRQMERVREAMESEDLGEIEWPDLVKDKMGKEREVVADNWSYEKSIQDRKQRKEEDEFREMMEAEKRRRDAIRRRRPLRIIYMLIFTLICIVGAYAANEYVNKTDEPKSKDEALVGLQDWVAAQQTTFTGYNDAFGQNPIACSALKDVSVAAKPSWVTDTNEYLTDYTTLVTGLNALDTTIQEIKTSVDQLCEGNESLDSSNVDVIDITGRPLQALRSAGALASSIEQERNVLATATEAPAEE